MKAPAVLWGTLLMVLSGCGAKSPSVAGTWATSTETKSGSNAPANQANFSFLADHTMSFTVTNLPGRTPYKLTGTGTWDSTATTITVTPLTMKLEGVSDETVKRLRPALDGPLKRPQTGQLTWNGPDKFVLHRVGGSPPQTFTRTP